MKVQNTTEEPIYFDHFDGAGLQKNINTQHKVIEYMKKQKHKKLYSILVIIDDLADDYKASHDPILNSLFTRGRHNSISTIVSTQKFKAISNMVRVNCTDLYVYRIRNYSELEALVDE